MGVVLEISYTPKADLLEGMSIFRNNSCCKDACLVDCQSWLIIAFNSFFGYAIFYFSII